MCIDGFAFCSSCVAKVGSYHLLEHAKSKHWKRDQRKYCFKVTPKRYHVDKPQFCMVPLVFIPKWALDILKIIFVIELLRHKLYFHDRVCSRNLWRAWSTAQRVYHVILRADSINCCMNARVNFGGSSTFSVQERCRIQLYVLSLLRYVTRCTLRVEHLPDRRTTAHAHHNM